MNKKDRIAVVVTVLYLLFPLFILTNGKVQGAFILCIPTFLYWGYRFIKNDISFLNNNSMD